MIHKILRGSATALAAATLMAGAVLGLAPGIASATPGVSGVSGVSGISSGTAPDCTQAVPCSIAGDADQHSDGTAYYTTDAKSGAVTITLTPADSLSFTGGFVCVGDAGTANVGTAYFATGSGFTGRPNPSAGRPNGCPPSGDVGNYFRGEQFSGGGPWTIDVPSIFITGGFFLSIHVDVSNGDTGFPCFQAGSTSTASSAWYGNCAALPGTSVPLGTIGGVGVAVIAGGALAAVQFRRRRRLQGAPRNVPVG